MANKILATTILVKNAAASAWTSVNPVLLKGEIGYESDTKRMKIGDGVTQWNSLAYSTLTPTDVMLKSVYDSDGDGQVEKADEADVAVKLKTARTINGVSFDGSANITVYDSSKIPTTDKGANNGVATLGADGKVPSAQLPSYVDDVIDSYVRTGGTALAADWLSAISAAGAALTPEAGKLYVIISSGDYLNKQYRWSGSAYVEIHPAPDYATQAEAEAGAENTKTMTALRTKQAIDSQRAYATTKTGLTSGGTGVVGTSAKVAREDHTHDLPAYPSALPPNGSAGGDLSGSYPNPTIGAGKVTDTKLASNAVTTAKIADGNVTDAKLDTVNVQKLFIASGDALILDGGTVTP